MKRIMQGAVLVACLAMAAGPGMAANYFFDPFDYSPLSGNLEDTANWQSHGKTPTYKWQVSATDLDGTGGSMAYPSDGAVYQEIKRLGAQGTAYTSGKVYIGFQMNLTDISNMTGAGAFLRPMDDTGNNYTSNAYLQIEPAPDGDLLDGTEYIVKDRYAGTSGIVMDLFTTYQVIWGLDLDNEQSAIWVDGALGADWTTYDSAKTLNNVRGLAFVDWGGNTPTAGNYDAVGIGTSPATTPEPTTLGLLGAGLLALLRRRRR